MQEIIDIINDKNEVVGSCPKDEIYSNKHLHRIVHILIFSKQGELLLQHRSKHKNYLPGYWGTSVGGHVMSGETPKEAARREMEEELGVRLKFEPLAEDWFDSVDETGLRKLLITFKAVGDGLFKPSKDEVENVEFYSLKKIKQMIDAGDKIHPELKFLVEKHL